VTITDDDGPGNLWFAAPASPTITEHGGSTTVKVRRTGGSIGAVGATIRIGGTAATGERVVTPKTVTFADGDTTAKVIRITAVDDSVVDGNKRVTLLLVNATGGVTLGTYRPTVTIVDNDG
jgi:hypothetical protein